MNLLAIETATEACSIALLSGGEVLERHEIAPRKHAELSLSWIEELLAEAGLHRQQLDAVACGHGPGAFTGVRLAVAMTQALALGLDIPAIGISTLHALALPALRDLEAENDRETRVLAALDARMGEIYVAEFQRDPAGARHRAGEEQVMAPDHWPVTAGVRYLGVGTGWAAENACLSTRLAANLVRVNADALPHASDVARLASVALTKGEGDAPEALQPAYLRNKVAQTMAERGVSI